VFENKYAKVHVFGRELFVLKSTELKRSRKQKKNKPGKG